MADGVKNYKIVINGIEESISAVDKLVSSLKSLEERINELSSKTINIATPTVSTTSTGGDTKKSSSTSSLSEEEKLQRQIAQLEEKRVAYQGELYQGYLANKELLKETVDDQKQLAAQERLTAGAYSNTMQGLKQELADIKQAMQTVDLGDGDTFKKMTERANELNEKLKEIEKSYGQFGRNVGNYPDVSKGIDSLVISVNGIEREFASAREAGRTLREELYKLELQGKSNTKEADELRSAYYRLQSAMDDATKSSRAMDEAMDYMQSFTAMASVGNGLKGFFGFDDNEITKSIQRLVALQGVLNGLETLRKQMETGEGFGKIFTKSFEQVDAASNKMLVYNRALLGTGPAAKAAAVGIKGLGVAFKALASIGIVALISGIVWAIQKVVEVTSEWAKGNADLVTSEQRLKIALDLTNDALERNLKLNQAKYNAKEINSVQLQEENEKAYARAIAETNKELEKRLKLNSNNSTFANAVSNAGRQSGVNEFLNNDKGVTTLGGFNEASKDVDELIRRYKALDEAVKNNTGLVYKSADGFEKAHLTASDAKDELNHLEQFLAGNMVGAMKSFDLATDEGRKGLKNFVTQIMNSDNEIYKSLLMRLPEIVNNEKGELGNALKQWLTLIKQFVAQANSELKLLNFQEFANSLLDAADETGERLAKRQKDELKARYEALSDEEKKQQKKLYEDALAAIDKNEAKKRQKTTNNYKKLESEVREAENDLNNLRISNMKEGLNKVIKQLEEERKQRLAKVQADGRLVNERQLEINKLYDKKIEDAKREHAEKVQQIYRTMWDNIYSYSLETTSMGVDLTNKASENGRTNYNFGRNTKGAPYRIKDENATYGVQGANQLKQSTYDELGFVKENNKKLSDTYNQRSEIIKKYWKDRIAFETSAITANYNAQVYLENENYEKQRRDNAAHAQELHTELEKNLKNGLITQKDYDEILERNIVEHQQRELMLEQQHNVNIKQLEQDRAKSIQNANAESYNERLQELRDFQTAISNLEAKQPVYNSFGLINGKKTNENNRNLLEAYKTVANEIVEIKNNLQRQLDNNEISFDDFQNANRELDAFAENVGQKMEEVKSKLNWGNQIAAFLQSAQQYIQAGMDSFNTIMNAVWSAQDTQFDKEQEALNKENEMIQDALSKQDEIIEQHKNKVESIEDELANSRGARRQHLIDQLNAEMEAERRAQKEKQRLQKQEEANKKKQDKLELERKKAEYDRNKLQAAVNGAMAITYAMMNPWPHVAIPMIALAASTTATQLAIMAANKPFKKGGVLEGPSHAQGGIKVYGGYAEVEGHEYIVNKETTLQNEPLLEYINSKHRRIDLSDMIDFYSSTGKIRKNIQGIKTRYADGGSLPALPNNLDIRDQLSNIIINQDNRPVVVSVKEILNTAEKVRYVETLAGLPPSSSI